MHTPTDESNAAPLFVRLLIGDVRVAIVVRVLLEDGMLDPERLRTMMLVRGCCEAVPEACAIVCTRLGLKVNTGEQACAVLRARYRELDAWTRTFEIPKGVRSTGQSVRRFRVLSAIPQHAVRGFRPTVLAAVKVNGMSLQWAHPVLQDDREIVIAAVCAKAKALRYASRRLANDPVIVMRAVQTDGSSLVGASHRLAANIDIVSAAVQQNLEALRYVRSDEPALWNALRPFTIAALGKSGWRLRDSATRLLMKTAQLLQNA